VESKTVDRKFYEAMLDEIDQMDSSAFPPHTDADEEEAKVIGVCPEYLRKVWALHRFYEREYRRGKTELAFESTDAKRRAAIPLVMNRMKGDILEKLFWYGMNCTFNTDADTFLDYIMGMRAEWQVVLTKRKPTPDMPPFLRKYLGTDDDD